MRLGALAPKETLILLPQNQVKRQNHADNFAISQLKKQQSREKDTGVSIRHRRHFRAAGDCIGLEIALAVALERPADRRKPTKKN